MKVIYIVIFILAIHVSLSASSIEYKNAKLSVQTNTDAYNVKKIFRDIDREYIANMEEISENQKNAILKLDFLIGSESCEESSEQTDEEYPDTKWYVENITNLTLRLGQCDASDQNIEIILYAKKSGGYMAVIVSINAQMTSLLFFPHFKKT